MGRTSLAIAPSNQNVIYALSASIAAGTFSGGGLHAVWRSTSGGDPGSWSRPRPEHQRRRKLNTLLLSNPVVASQSRVLRRARRVLQPGLVRQRDRGRPGRTPTSSGRAASTSSARRRRRELGARVALVAPAETTGRVRPRGPARDRLPSGLRRRRQQDDVRRQRRRHLPHRRRPGGRRDRRSQRACDPANGDVQWTIAQQRLRRHAVLRRRCPIPTAPRTSAARRTTARSTARTRAGPDAWQEILGGDGGYVAVDPTDTDVLYAESQNFGFEKSLTGPGGPWVPATTGVADQGLDFITPFAMDPTSSQRLWTGGCVHLAHRQRRDELAARQRDHAGPGLGQRGRGRPRPTPNRVLVGMTDGFIVRHASALTTTRHDGLAERAAARRLGVLGRVRPDRPGDRVRDLLDLRRRARLALHRLGRDLVAARRRRRPARHPGPLDRRRPDRTRRASTSAPTSASTSRPTAGATWNVENTGFANVVTERAAALVGRRRRSCSRSRTGAAPTGRRSAASPTRDPARSELHEHLRRRRRHERLGDRGELAAATSCPTATEWRASRPARPSYHSIGNDSVGSLKSFGDARALRGDARAGQRLYGHDLQADGGSWPDRAGNLQPITGGLDGPAGTMGGSGVDRARAGIG